jgi:UPF0271 protein
LSPSREKETEVKRSLDVNVDCGEGFGNWKIGDDEALFPFVSSVNLACGFHAGDPTLMVQTVRKAKEAGIAVGCHPGLPDLMGFGRRRMSASPEEIYAYVLYQAGALKAILEAEGMELNHVKVHGALAFMAKEDEATAAAVLAAVCAISPRRLMYSPGWPDSKLHDLAEAAGVEIIKEFYPDIRYLPDGGISLERHRAPVSPAEVDAQLQSLVTEGNITAENGTLVSMDVEALSFHGDAPNAIEVGTAIRAALTRLDVEVAARQRSPQMSAAPA